MPATIFDIVWLRCFLSSGSCLYAKDFANSSLTHTFYTLGWSGDEWQAQCDVTKWSNWILLLHIVSDIVSECFSFLWHCMIHYYSIYSLVSFLWPSWAWAWGVVSRTATCLTSKPAKLPWRRVINSGWSINFWNYAICTYSTSHFMFVRLPVSFDRLTASLWSLCSFKSLTK